MSTTERTREAVADRLARLHDRYDAFRVFGDTVTLPAERYARLESRVAEGTPVGVGCWTERPDGGLLMVRDREGPAVWTLPGGPVASGETPEAAAGRWVEARTGVAPTVGDVLLVRQRRVRPAGGGDPLHTLWAVFEGSAADAVPTAGDGTSEARWWAEHPGPVDERIQGRVRAWAAGNVPRVAGH